MPDCLSLVYLGRDKARWEIQGNAWKIFNKKRSKQSGGIRISRKQTLKEEEDTQAISK